MRCQMKRCRDQDSGTADADDLGSPSALNLLNFRVGGREEGEHDFRDVLRQRYIMNIDMLLSAFNASEM